MGWLDSLLALLGIGGASALVWWVRSLMAHAEARGELRERYRWSTALADRQEELQTGDQEAFAAHAHRMLEIRDNTEDRLMNPSRVEVKRYLKRSKAAHRPPLEVDLDDL